MKTTSIKYCSSCLADFREGETVYFVYYDNNCVCKSCSKSVNSKLEKRFFLGVQ
jgi:recombinational DNA repair protein (RecF pathway)